MSAISFTILGECASKANSRAIATQTYRGADSQSATRPRVIKSTKALAFEASALKQIPPHCRVRLMGPVCVTLHLYYASERPDLSEELLLDVLQDRWKVVTIGRVKARVLVQAGAYRNDRQVREKHVFHHIDRRNPRAEICIEPLETAPCALLATKDQSHEPEAARDPCIALRSHPRPRIARSDATARGGPSDH